MKIRIWLLLLLVALLSACGEDEVDCSDPNAAVMEINDQLTNVQDLQTEYTSDPSDIDKCNELREAFEDLVDLLEDYSECPDLDQTTISNNLQITRDNLQQLNCN